MQPKTSTAFLRLFLLGLAVLIAAEVGVRLFITSPSRQIFDPELGYTYRPHSVIFRTKEGGARIHINSLGMNDEEPEEKAGRFRVIALGDSITEALQVPSRDNYTSISEELAPSLDVINAARSAAGPLHYPIILSRVQDRLLPDLILVQFSPKDLDDILKTPAVFLVDEETKKIREITLEVARKEKLKEIIRPLIQRSALATYLIRRLKPVVNDLIRFYSRKSLVLGQKPALAFARPENAPRDPVKILAHILEKLSERSPVVAMHIPALTYLHGRRAEISEESLKEELIFRQASELAGVPFLQTATYLSAVYAETGQPPHGFANYQIAHGHLNEAGHRAVAMALTDFLRAERKIGHTGQDGQ